MEIVAQPQEEVTTKRGGKKFSVRGALGKRRKVMILAGMFVLLVVTGYLNWSLNNTTPEVGGGTGGGGNNQHMFYTFRQVRDTEHRASMLMYENMATNQAMSAEARANAEARIMEISAARLFESQAENLILAAGFQDSIVTKSGENINVHVRNTENLTPVQVTQIKLILDSVANRVIDIDNIFVTVVQ
ncbi:MAG: SpoIIIAH-like family protein [Firmicutes bacterium]|nr:SpoIIIAH-like family protein [Bacillota bacterium]